MAKIKFGQGVAKIMGTIGGTIFSQNASGNYAKNYNTPTNPQTEKQLFVRGLFAAMSTAWANLTEGERAAWNGWAETLPYTNSVGDEYFLSGKGLYQKANTALRNVGVAALTEAPDTFEVPDPPANISIAASEGAPSLVISSDDAVVPADRTFILDGSPMSTPARVNNNSLFKRVGYQNAAAIVDTWDVAAGYSNIFGQFLETQRVEIRCAYISTLNGMQSTYVKASCIVAA